MSVSVGGHHRIGGRAIAASVGYLRQNLCGPLGDAQGESAAALSVAIPVNPARVGRSGDECNLIRDSSGRPTTPRPFCTPFTTLQ